MKVRLLSLVIAVVGVFPLSAADLPNILWITSEDNSSQWIGCYGNPQASTPRIDALAKEGVLFEHAYSNGPVCAVARSTLLNGAYAPTMGTQHMRSRHVIPAKYRPYVEYLRKAGYYCTNNAKTDYNFKGDDKAIWDESSKKAHYRNRPADAPFFAVFNIELTHESSLFGNREREPQRLSVAEVELPPYVPDLPEMRRDFARYHDRVSAMDRRVGEIVDELAARGLADDTIVIYNSDHGGATPRGKRYLYDTGVKVPLVVRVPEKWRALCGFQPGERVAETVAFVDFAPTFLSLAGISRPPQMQGRAFLGVKREEPGKDDMEFLYADRFDEIYGMRRGLTDGRWKYVRCFTPNLPAAPYSFYQSGQPAWKEWERAWKEGRVSGAAAAIWESPQATEELYDLLADPWEVRNLAADPGHAEKLAALRNRLSTTMEGVADTSLVPEPLFDELGGTEGIAGFVQGPAFSRAKAVSLAFAASGREAAALPELMQALGSVSPVERYWGAQGVLMMPRPPVEALKALEPLLEDDKPVIRTVAAEALWRTGRNATAHAVLLAELDRARGESLLYLLNAFRRLDLVKDIPQGWAEAKASDPGAQDYVGRFLKRADAGTE